MRGNSDGHEMLPPARTVTNTGWAVLRCTRCRVALAPRQRYHEGMATFLLVDGYADGPCIDPQTGAAVMTHPSTQIDMAPDGSDAMPDMRRSD